MLPESDLNVTLSEATEFPTSTGRLDQFLGEDPIPIAVFKIQSGKSEPVTHMALANLPMVPNVIPSSDASTKAAAASAGCHSLHGHADARSQDERALRADRHPGRAERGALLSRFRPRQRGEQGRASRFRAT